MTAQRGNILFLILLAVVLFAALSYAVTSSTRGGGRDASQEKTDMLAAQMLQAASLTENTIMRAMTVDGIKEYGFDVSGTNSARTPNGTCTQAACKLFTGNGGGIALPMIPPAGSTSNLVNEDERKAIFYVAKIHSVGTEEPDLIMQYTFLTKDLCDALNRGTGTTDVNLGQSQIMGGTNRDYTGTLTAMPASTALLGDQIPSVRGKRSFCYYNSTGGGQYQFVHVLIAR